MKGKGRVPPAIAKNTIRRIAPFGGKPRTPESLIPPEAIPEPPPPTPDRVRPKSQKGKGRA